MFILLWLFGFPSGSRGATGLSFEKQQSQEKPRLLGGAMQVTLP